eukprot:CAMPEP_0115669850 /NCGR_PEP_ID=MMETSP0272-20121206/51218_1 /TAXON_ID=71861 /ORGANISM="Scrippsiella trochoidea, Strain CCMP3099" /LENGTH=100 /DNA_ID=CAMNT_0003108541 /DNA_START=1072 /DNA_END=1372 /DNA_ORIENTATION=-
MAVAAVMRNSAAPCANEHSALSKGHMFRHHRGHNEVLRRSTSAANSLLPCANEHASPFEQTPLSKKMHNFVLRHWTRKRESRSTEAESLERVSKTGTTFD